MHYLHDIITWILIIAIVIIQVKVFRITKRKIEIYKNIIPDQSSFSIVNVSIPETEIESIRLKDIYMNLNDLSKKNNGNDIENIINITNNADENDIDSIHQSVFSFTVEVDKKSVVLNQELYVTYSMNRDCNDFTTSFDDFVLINGPKQEVSQSWLNGKIIFTKFYFYKIKPIKTGVLLINEATVEYDGNIYKSNAVEIKVREH